MKNISRFVEILAILLLVFIWGFTVFNFNQLPDIIPTHFGSNGKPDGFSSRNSIWMLPLISLGVFSLLYFLSRNPNSVLLNLPKNIKEDPKISALIVSLINVVILAMIAEITYHSFLTAFGISEGLNIFLMTFLLITLLLIIGASLIYSWKISKKTI